MTNDTIYDDGQPCLGIIGGSGLYDLDQLEDTHWISVDTPFGAPSDKFLCGMLKGNTAGGASSVSVRLVFLPRHGRGHRLLPSELNYKANICGFKQLGVSWLLSVSAVGSLREQYAPGDIVFVDQYLDFTKKRDSSFFGSGAIGHVSCAEPTCKRLTELASTIAMAALGQDAKQQVHIGGTYICIEGPQFSTRAESLLFRQWGADVIGMTNMPEAKLAREAGISYAPMAMVTDYDSWNAEREAVKVATVLSTLRQNAELAQSIVTGLGQGVTALPLRSPFSAETQSSMLSPIDSLDPSVADRLRSILI